MSLALAEILISGDGNNSLDRIREKHRGHGLEFKLGSDSIKTNSIDLISASPTKRKNRNYGTFWLWHSLTHSESIVGTRKTDMLDHGSTLEQTSFLLHGGTQTEKVVGSLDLLSVVQRIPHLSNHLESFNITSSLVRSTFSATIKQSQSVFIEELRWITHPCREDLLESAIQQMLVHPSEVPNVESRRVPNGIIVKSKSDYNQPIGHIQYPEGISITPKSTYVISKKTSLNEFGNLYLASYLLGMLCRYYPDLWMKELEDRSDFFALCEILIDAIEQRLAVSSAKNILKLYLIYSDV
jgi:hypothetical protein